MEQSVVDVYCLDGPVVVVPGAVRLYPRVLSPVDVAVPEPRTLDADALTGMAEASLTRGNDGADVPLSSQVSTSTSSGSVSGRFLLQTPLSLQVSNGAFEALDHNGHLLIRLSANEVASLPAFAVPSDLDGFVEAAARLNPPSGLEPDEVRLLAHRLIDSKILEVVEPEDEARRQDRLTGPFREAMKREREFIRVVRESVEAHNVEEAEQTRLTGITRTEIVPVLTSAYTLPLALGMVIATSRTYKDGALNEWFDFFPRWHCKGDQIQDGARRVYLLSNYVWDHGSNLELARTIKEKDPLSLVIAGGPDTPKYHRDNEQYLWANTYIDVTVHGEGEATLSELLEALVPQVRDQTDAAKPFDLSVLRDVPGLSFRLGNEVIHSPDRGRIENFEAAPSPFAMDIFDAFVTSGSVQLAIVETNRGCPYGCTYCDWGSATASRIRKFEMDRVFAELEWCAKNRVPRLTIADANFGIWERDVEIAEKVAELKAEYGYPLWFATNYAKNTMKHLRTIVEVLLKAGIHTEGLLSLQSMDADTLEVVRRSNIKMEKYEELAREFRRHKMPLFVDLMLGLPGATVSGFANDLQECINREVTAKVFRTEMLVNSPMNEPEYREQYRIKIDDDDAVARPNTRRRSLIVSSSSFTQAECNEMLLLRRAFLAGENYGVLRYISRYVRQETGVREVQLLQKLLERCTATPDRWPILSHCLLSMPDMMTPPVSWSLYIDELRDFLVQEVGVVDDSALATALAVQHAMLPSRDRVLPLTVPLDHDYAAWHQTVMEAKDTEVMADWENHTPHLRTYGPGVLVVDDPNGLCQTNFGFSIDGSSYNDWELDSAVARPMPAEYNLND